MNGLREDVAYACRSLGRSPGFALVVVFTLAIGIGMNWSSQDLVDS